MSSFKVPLKIDQGGTFQKVVTWKAGTPATPVDLTGCSALAHIRAKISSPTTLLELSTSDGTITLGDDAGTVTIAIDAETTAAITWTQAVYDLEIYFPDGTVRRLLNGSVTVSPEVTRD